MSTRTPLKTMRPRTLKGTKYTGRERSRDRIVAYQRGLLAGTSMPMTQFIPRGITSGIETKGVDASLALAPIIATTNTNGSIILANIVQSGTGSWNRIGKKITMKSLRLKGFINTTITPTAVTFATSDNLVRMIIIYDRQTSGGALPTFDTMFGITDGAGNESCPDIYCPPRYDNMERFRVLKECIYDTNAGIIMSGGTTNATTVRNYFDEYISLKGLDSVFLSTANPITSADIASGGLYVVFRAQNNGDTVSSVVGNARLRYRG